MYNVCMHNLQRCLFGPFVGVDKDLVEMSVAHSHGLVQFSFFTHADSMLQHHQFTCACVFKFLYVSVRHYTARISTGIAY